MNPEEPQTPEQKLEQAFIAESEETNWSDEEDEQEAQTENIEPVEHLEPLPELKMHDSIPSETEATDGESEVPETPQTEEIQAIEEIEEAPTSVSWEATAASETEPIEDPETEATKEDLDREVPSEPVDLQPADLEVEDRKQQIAALDRQKQVLDEEIRSLQARKDRMLSEQMAQLQATLDRLTKDSLSELEGRKQALQSSIEQLERRRDRIREEMRASFAGVSQDMAIRVQGFKDYLVGSLQDLAAAAEQLELPNFEARAEPKEEPRSPKEPSRGGGRREARGEREEAPTPRFAKQGFQEQRQQISNLLEQYRIRPDYYGPPWQLRRTFEPIHAERVQKWFFAQGGRGAIRTMGSRLQNILIAAAAMSVLRNLYGDRLRILVLANTPERLGEWRRGLQDCLGISRSDFGPTRGVVLFESPEALVQKAERLVEDKQLPLVVIDEAEGQIDLSLLQFPLWFAFAPDPNPMSSYTY